MKEEAIQVIGYTKKTLQQDTPAKIREKKRRISRVQQYRSQKEKKRLRLIDDEERKPKVNRAFGQRISRNIPKENKTHRES
ncbi:4644_t:CDS:2 [Dentiscutata erythropus]|uniref:4644_t:CDS:1 n=1 Tax=Dentiscutata erythropus TaxID=1348616 RepID=A0A9N9DE81_9GLOM|nr:4644_t:CDS:2 [Dentiscutata erythropus]